ncbi:MAG: M23 family metallopeptidase [Coleofasciculaceae cyanobacterium SM2_3_26]|nr:M23 family metallopeptidase [Coleofasciculaceae cyanobacterium SM2_3_26]
MHTGVDLGAPLGTPILAAYSGEVVFADWRGGYGLAVILRHDEGTRETLYAHMSELLVRPGEVVEQGAVIGLVGSTGLSTGPHLHFEHIVLTENGWVKVDPGAQLEDALATLIRSLEVARSTQNWGKLRVELTLPLLLTLFQLEG